MTGITGTSVELDRPVLPLDAIALEGSEATESKLLKDEADEVAGKVKRLALSEESEFAETRVEDKEAVE